jgi:hypothetical protein
MPATLLTVLVRLVTQNESSRLCVYNYSIGIYPSCVFIKTTTFRKVVVFPSSGDQREDKIPLFCSPWSSQPQLWSKVAASGTGKSFMKTGWCHSPVLLACLPVPSEEDARNCSTLTTKLLTNSMEQSHSWQADSRSGSQEIPEGALLPCSQKPATSHCPETDGSSPIYFKIHLVLSSQLRPTREWSGWSGRNLTWNFARLQSPSSNDCTQKFSCFYAAQGCEKIAQIWNIQFKFAQPRTRMTAVCLPVALYSPVHSNESA